MFSKSEDFGWNIKESVAFGDVEERELPPGLVRAINSVCLWITDKRLS